MAFLVWNARGGMIRLIYQTITTKLINNFAANVRRIDWSPSRIRWFLSVCKFSQLMSDTRPGRGIRWDEPPLLKVCEKQRCRSTTSDAPSQGPMKWKEHIIWVWGNGGMKFVPAENGRNSEKIPARFRFFHNETYMEWPSRELGTSAAGGEHLIACATEQRFYQ